MTYRVPEASKSPQFDKWPRTNNLKVNFTFSPDLIYKYRGKETGTRLRLSPWITCIRPKLSLISLRK